MLCNDVKDVKLRYACDCAPRGGSSTLQVKEKKELKKHERSPTPNGLWDITV